MSFPQFYKVLELMILIIPSSTGQSNDKENPGNRPTNDRHQARTNSSVQSLMKRYKAMMNFYTVGEITHHQCSIKALLIRE